MSIKQATQPTYDAYGRMNYHPEFHPNQGAPWTTTDQNYLIEFYEKFGPEQVSLELGRTICGIIIKCHPKAERRS